MPQKQQYWISFIDDCTCYHVVYLLHKKSDTFVAFKEFKAFAEKQTGFTLGALQDDKGGEYMSKEMDQFLKLHGITRKQTTTATPQQNRVAECSNWILTKVSPQYLMNHSSLDPSGEMHRGPLSMS